MSTVAELYDATNELRNHLKEPLPKEEREPYIEKVASLLKKRQKLIGSFQRKTARSEQELADTIAQWNKEISQRLEIYLNSIKVDMNKLKQQKDSGMKYENPYTSQPDGFFIDKKN